MAKSKADDRPKMKDGLIKRGEAWYYVVRVRDPLTGRKKPKWVGAFETQQAAKVARDEARDMANKGTAVAASRITVREYLEQWLVASETRIRPTTLASYEQHVRNHIVPRIGGERLQQLTPLMVEALYGALLKEGHKPKTKTKEGEKPAPSTPLSASTVRRVGATLHKALSDARKKQLIPYNPADGVDLPKVERDADGAGDMKTWTREELDAFLAHLTTDRLFPMWQLVCWTGMRRGEVAGLTWRDIDLDEGTIRVRRARVAVTSQDVRESKPKTGKGRRLVELDEETQAALVAWQERQDAEREEWPGEWPDHDLVFTLEDGSPLHPDYLSRAFRSHQRRVATSLAERAKKDRTKGRKPTLSTIRFHDLRHTHATLLLAAGVPVKVVSERLGHGDPAFTMKVYQHVLPGDQRGHVQNVANAKSKAARHLTAVAS